MVSLITNLKLILPALVLLNVVAFFLFKGKLRFVKGPFILFALLLVNLLVYRFIIYPTVNSRIRNEKAEIIQERGWDYLNDPELDDNFYKQKKNNIIIGVALYRIVGLQTVLAFILAVGGIFATTDKKIYSFYALGFLVLAIVLLK
jgi:hypothetical protein